MKKKWKIPCEKRQFSKNCTKIAVFWLCL